jgi:hypothetical protein
MNKVKKEIEALVAKIAPLRERISQLEYQEILENQRPRLDKLIGFCLHSTYSDREYGKIIDLVDSKDGTPYFILKILSITKEGNPYIHLDSVHPYLNKEWWDKEIPMSGWEKCSEEEYLSFEKRIIMELSTQKSLRKFVKRIEY